MRWRKLGNIFDPRDHAWAGTHAQVPTVLVRSDHLRIYYADRTAEGRSFITFLDVDREDFSRITYCHKEAVLNPAAPGTFDDDGSMPGCICDLGERLYMFYTGWNRRVGVPYHNAIGLAVSRDLGTTFERMFQGPILDRTPEEPYIAVTPWVMRERTTWRMWYAAGLAWVSLDDGFEPTYTIKRTASRDGIRWERPGATCIEPKHDFEACTHPTVVTLEGAYHMWYCFRDANDYRDGSGSYRIGYARSDDGQVWQRLDEQSGIDPSGEGWDSAMICYPYVVEVDNRLVMFYNGNGFGRTGIGCAVLEQ